MKVLARGTVRWHGMNDMVEEARKCCVVCQLSQPLLISVPMQLWIQPTTRSRLHEYVAFGFVELLNGKMFVRVVDTFSKWSEVIPTKTAPVPTTAQRLQTLFTILESVE